jgi:hypothetical protein
MSDLGGEEFLYWDQAERRITAFQDGKLWRWRCLGWCVARRDYRVIVGTRE